MNKIDLPKVENIDDIFNFFPYFPESENKRDQIIANLLGKSQSTVASWRKAKKIPQNELQHLEAVALHAQNAAISLQYLASKKLGEEILLNFVQQFIKKV
ncbi:MAG: hypothetical protein F6J93_37650 [Oscillatoria sp. SIO1A7]|nr:hypothetical protein [Oscillatoria sp. SIO1A7]